MSNSPGEGSCFLPLQIISRTRELDLTECFELAVLLPFPLVLAILVGTSQVSSISRRIKRGPLTGGVIWVNRSVAGERVCRIKLVRSS